MVVVIDYKLDERPVLIEFLTEMKVDFHYTNSEEVISRAALIILPDTNDIKNAMRQLHLLNLFSILRVINKPILGIAHGFELMCEFAGKNHTACLGLLPIDFKSDNENRLQGFYSLERVQPSFFFTGINKDDKFYFDFESSTPANEQTLAVIEGGSSAALFENNKFLGTLFLPEKSGEPGKKFLRNFFYHHK